VFDIVLPAAIGKQKKRVTLRENQNFLTRDDVIKLVTNAPNLREKAIILCMASSGMARQEVLNLKINDIVFDNETNIGVVSIRRQKSQTDYTTFISPEAVIALKTYFDERNRKPETAIKGKTENVFVRYEGGRMNERTFIKIFQNLGRKLGYENGDNFTKSRSHALRKYFATTLENTGFPKNKVDFMLGHTQSGNDAAYFQVDIEALKQLYIKFLPYLTFEKTIEIRSLDTADAKRLEELAKENIRLKEKLESKDTETQDLKKRLDRLESALQSIVSAAGKK
jgi:integrase